MQLLAHTFRVFPAAMAFVLATIGSAHADALEWSLGSLINLGPGSASAINNAGQVVGTSTGGAVEWSNGSVVVLGPGVASGINNVGQVVGHTYDSYSNYAREWTNGSMMVLTGPPGSVSFSANSINSAG